MFSFISGLVFGLGLIVSGMTNPAKVLAFLDLAGQWDPSLMLVMASAIGIGVAGFALANRRQRSWLGYPMLLASSRQLDKRLIGGSVAFGVGWGLAGICPGPALVLLGIGRTEAPIFVGAMMVGMATFELLERWPKRH